MMMITTTDSIGGAAVPLRWFSDFHPLLPRGVGGMNKRAKEAWSRRLSDDYLETRRQKKKKKEFFFEGGENRSMTAWNQSIGQREATLNRTGSRRKVMPISGKDFSTIEKRKTPAESLEEERIRFSSFSPLKIKKKKILSRQLVGVGCFDLNWRSVHSRGTGTRFPSLRSTSASEFFVFFLSIQFNTFIHKKMDERKKEKKRCKEARKEIPTTSDTFSRVSFCAPCVCWQRPLELKILSTSRRRHRT